LNGVTVLILQNGYVNLVWENIRHVSGLLSLLSALGGIIWYQGTVITSHLTKMDSYSRQLESLKAQSGAGVTIYKDDKQKNTYLVVLPKKAHGTGTYTSTAGNTVMKYIAK